MFTESVYRTERGSAGSKVYFDVSAPKIKEFTEAGLRQPASDAGLTSSIRRYRARFCNNRAHLEVTHN